MPDKQQGFLLGRLIVEEYRDEADSFILPKDNTSWGQDTASPFIMENDKLMAGWRPNPDSGSSAIG